MVVGGLVCARKSHTKSLIVGSLLFFKQFTFFGGLLGGADDHLNEPWLGFPEFLKFLFVHSMCLWGRAHPFLTHKCKVFFIY